MKIPRRISTRSTSAATGSALTGKVCVVTGAGSGIGRALALELAGRGARLALSDVDEIGLTETAALTGISDAHTRRLDVADRTAFIAYADEVASHFGVVHQIYNNAGITAVKSATESDWSDYERVLNINLWGVIHGTKVFLPHLIASGDGHVINVSSLNGIMAQPGMSHYCASKFAVRGFTEALQAEFQRDGVPVRTTVVHPGGVRTNIANAWLNTAKADGHAISAEDEKRRAVYNEKLLKMDPAGAAKIIVDGVVDGRARVLVGSDAKALDAVVRVVPRLYPRLVVRLERTVNR